MEFHVVVPSGEKLEFTFEITTSSNNCGMKSLISFGGSLVASQDSWTASLDEKALVIKLVDDNERLILEQFLKTVPHCSLYVLSTGVIKGVLKIDGRKVVSRRDFANFPPCDTSWLMRALVKNKVGSCTLSPIVENYAHPKMDSHIQALLWVPPNHTKRVSVEGRAYPMEGGITMPEAAEVAEAYNNWMGYDKES